MTLDPRPGISYLAASMKISSTLARLVPGVAILALIFGPPLGCGGGGQGEGAPASEELRELEFQIDSALLGPVLADSALGIAIRPPSFFQPAAEGIGEAIREQVAAEQQAGDSLATAPAVIYGWPGSIGLFIISRFRNPPTGGVQGEWLDALTRRVRDTVAPAEVKSDLYRHGPVRIAQFLAQNETMVLFRLVAWRPGGEPVQVDYLIPSAQYESVWRGVESSIGSLQMFAPGPPGPGRSEDTPQGGNRP